MAGGHARNGREEQHILSFICFLFFIFGFSVFSGPEKTRKVLDTLLRTYWGGIDTVLIDLHSIFHDRAKPEMGRGLV